MLSQNISQCPLWKLPLAINEEVASKGSTSRFSVRGSRFMLGRCSCSLFRLVLNHWRLPYLGWLFGGWQIDPESAGGWGWRSNFLLPAPNSGRWMGYLLPPYGCLDDISWRIRCGRGWDCRYQCGDTFHSALTWPPCISTDWSSSLLPATPRTA